MAQWFTESPIRRFLFAVLVGVTVIIGLLAMHTLSASAIGHQAHAGMPMIHSKELLSPSLGGGSIIETSCIGDACDPMNGPMHSSAIVMTCILALLTLAILVRRLDRISAARRPDDESSRSVSLSIRRLPWPRPPSLLELSISRT